MKNDGCNLRVPCKKFLDTHNGPRLYYRTRSQTPPKKEHPIPVTEQRQDFIHG